VWLPSWQVEEIPLGVDQRKKRANLRSTVDLPGGFGRMPWHRLVCFAFSGLDKIPKDMEAHHTDDKWWMVRKGCLTFLSGEENRALQGESGLAGPAGSRKREKAPQPGKKMKKMKKD